MTDVTKVYNPLSAFMPIDIEGFDSLAELALDLRWSWNHSADELWRQLDTNLWEHTHNPWIVLKMVSRDRIVQMMNTRSFRSKLDDLLRAKRESAESATWFSRNHSGSLLKLAAYFSMEFMLSEALPIYSGGLGNVAGDQLKAASDLGVPVVGVGLLYQQGYFRQVVDRSGTQHALFPFNDPGQLPITPVREPNGEWLRIQLKFPGYTLWLRTWQVTVGRVKLYLLDSNDAANFPAHRGITSELYGGGPELRIQQEIVLGIGGWRLLAALGTQPDVCHLNEGHAAFAVLERAKSFMEKTGQPFEVALAATRAGNLFTTHTPVAAGFDRFPPSLVEHYLGRYAVDHLGIPFRDLLALGRENTEEGSEDFNMAYLAMRGSGGVNGVSRLHGEVSRHIFRSLFPRWPEAEVPVGHVTNGVHAPSWDSKEADALWTESCGKERWADSVDALEKKMRNVTDSRIWEFRSSTRSSLVSFVRRHLSLQLEVSGASAAEIDEAKKVLDENALTFGFARRFASYKRPNLLLHDPDRLFRILSDPQRPAQLIISGKAHPADTEGQWMIKQWIEFIHRPGMRNHVVFLSDYDMLITEHLVQGVDVWINTPRRPWEASGTSGMKVLVNGGLNLSELDGWWAEAYSPEVGWALGDGKEHDDEQNWDAVEAEALYSLLEHDIIPEFYSRDENDIPTKWIARMRESTARLTPQFSATRTVQEYLEDYYLPGATGYGKRAADNAALALGIANWKKSLSDQWQHLRFGEMKVETVKDEHLFEVEVYFSAINPDHVSVELYADGLNGGEPSIRRMIKGRRLSGVANGYLYKGTAPADRPPEEYTARLVPFYEGVSVPLEAPQILWQR
ncbi:MAG: alpha-glucan family phosphorylase [Bacteroidetes bacterium]|nr:alpha-glucan family phosphorylase [Bacteroidota bacterium]